MWSVVEKETCWVASVVAYFRANASREEGRTGL